MGIWQRIGGWVDGGARRVGALFDRLAANVPRMGNPAIRRQVAFSIAMVALSAKMAKADGVVTSDEVAAFNSIFTVSESEQRNVRRLFDLAKRDVSGFESYAGKIAELYGDDRPGLEDVVDGLFAIARADGSVHEAELVYLERVAGIFGIEGRAFDRIVARHVVPEEGDPYLILGVTRDMDTGAIRRAYLRLVAENHPDRLVARGMPAQSIAVANERTAEINRAFERIEDERRV